MLKREIAYEDFNENQVTDIVYFNISKPELIELEVEYKEGFAELLKRIIAANDHKELIKRFKEIVLMAYGEKSEDGKSFVKSDARRNAFSQTAAYNALFTELATDDNAASNFIKGVLPKDMSADFEKGLANVPPNVLSTPPTPPTPPNV